MRSPCRLLGRPRADLISHSFFLGFGSTSERPASALALLSRPTPLTSFIGRRGLSQGMDAQHLGGPAAQSTRVGKERGPAVLSHCPLGDQPALSALVTNSGHLGPGLYPLRGLSVPLLGLLALSLFFLRRLSIQLELERVVKLDRARELSRMFLPDMMSSPKPSWWEKA